MLLSPYFFDCIFTGHSKRKTPIYYNLVLFFKWFNPLFVQSIRTNAAARLTAISNQFHKRKNRVKIEISAKSRLRNICLLCTQHKFHLESNVIVEQRSYTCLSSPSLSPLSLSTSLLSLPLSSLLSPSPSLYPHSYAPSRHTQVLFIVKNIETISRAYFVIWL